eukprot:GHVL01031387.1.p1 GENE.GHVL01031387.1~~GHVL01031387.1.p1  ORF type:complete len:440 (-),score=83.98 GHVL01031387.1:425-1744(-)
MSWIPCLGDDNVEGDEVERSNWFGNMKNALITACIGILLVPGAVVLLGWNEKNSVCAERALDEGLSQLVTVKCDESDQSQYENDLIFFACPLDKTTYTDFSISKDFRGGELLDDIFTAKGTCMTQFTEMYQCNESKTSTTKKNVSGGKTTVTDYNYSVGWSSSLMDETSFCSQSTCTSKRDQACGTSKNPVIYPLAPGTQKMYASGVNAGVWRLSGNHVEEIPCDATVTANTTVSDETPVQVDPQPPVALTLNNIKIENDKLVTCWDSTDIGCMRASYSTNSASDVSVMSKYISGGNLGPWLASDSWMCSGYTLDELKMGIMTSDELGDVLEKENTLQLWILRLLGFILVWAGMFMCCAPITTCPDAIPVIGSIIGDVIGCILGCITCLLATCLSLIVIALAWIFVRPLAGGLLLGGALLCLGGVILVKVFWDRNEKDY